MFKKFLLALILTTTSASFSGANQTSCMTTDENECCPSQCCKYSCIDWKLYGGAALGAAVVGGVVGAFASKGKKGHKGSTGKPGPLPALTYDTDPSQTIEFSITLELNVAGPSPQITLTPFFTDPAGVTTKFAPFSANTSGIYSNPGNFPTMVANNLINGTYFWGFICEFQNASGSVINLNGGNSFWTAKPSRYPDIEIGIPPSVLNNTIISTDNYTVIQLPAKMEYDFSVF